MSELSFQFLKWQREVFADKHRFKVVVAGRRTGKTRFAATMLIIKALECTHKDATILYTSPTMQMSKVLMWDLIQELARPVMVKANINDGEITLVNGVKIRIRGADSPDSLRGMKLYYAVLDESKDMRENVWPLIIRPALSDLRGGALIIGTPEPGESQFRDQYEFGLSGEDDEWKSWLFPTSCNELIDPKEIEAARRSLSSQQFAQEYNADFNTYGQTVFKQEWLKYSDVEPSQGDYYIACDPAGFESVDDPNKKRHLDNTAIAVVKVTEEGKWWVKKIVFGRFDVRETAVQLLLAVRTYRPIAVGVERGALARALMPYFQDLSRKNGIYAHIEQIQIGGSSKTNRIVYALQGMFEHGRITLNSRENWEVFEKEYMNFPSKKVHDDCFPEDTPITTARGVVPISEVTIDDMVLTRNGYRRVLKAWCKGYADVITRYGITATPDHRVFTTNRGWVSLDKLVDEDMIVYTETIKETSCTHQSEKQPHSELSERKSSSMGAGTTDTLMQSKETISGTTHLTQSGKRLQDSCIETFGNSSTDQSQPVTMSTMKMVTSTIIDPKTSSVCQEPHTKSLIGMNDLNEQTQRSISNTLSQSENRQKHGMHRQRDASGIENTQPSPSLPEIYQNSLASFAGLCTNRSSIDQGCAVMSASEQGKMISSVKVPVYDLTVEKDHEFFAWGVLVHNCVDSLSLIQNLVTTTYSKYEEGVREWEPLDEISGI